MVALPGAALAGLGLYLVLLAAASVGYNPLRAPNSGAPTRRLDVLIPAHDEELLVGRCVASLLEQTYPRHLFRVLVIADNCSDGTAAVAALAGATAMVRDEPAARGKGHALRWAMDRLFARKLRRNRNPIPSTGC